MLEQSFGCRFFSQLDLASVGCRFFSQLGLTSEYWAIPITEADRCKTAFSIPRGKFQFRRMPFGLRNAQATFQRCMDNVVAECKKRGATGLDAYIDNVIISTVSFAEHCSTLAILLTVLDDLGMSLRHDKCEFAKSSIGFLGFRLDGQTIKPSLKNIDKIKEFPTPTTRKLLQRFLGLANYNRRFIERYSDLCKPLNKLTSSKVPFVWTLVET